MKITSIFVLFCLFCNSALAEISSAEKRISDEQNNNIQRLIKVEEAIKAQENLIQSIEKSKEASKKATYPLIAMDNKKVSNTNNCTHIKNIVVNDITVIPKLEINQITAQYLDQCLTMQDIQNVVNDITNLYLQKGFITSRAGLQLPQSGLKFGLLIISVLEGMIEKVEITAKPQHQSLTHNFLFSDLENQILNMRDIEIRLAQINRLVGQKATVDIIPGNQSNYSIVALKIENQSYQKLSASIDNSGSESTGKMKHTLKIDLNNELGLNENISLSVSENYEENKALHMSEARNLSISMPYYDWLLTYKFSKSKYLTHQVLSNNDILYTYGNTVSNTFNFEKTLFQESKSKGVITSNLITKDEVSFTRIRDLDSKSEIGSRKLATLDIGYQYTYFLDNSVLFLNPSMHKGLDIFGALSDDESALATKAQFFSLKFFGYWQKPFELLKQQLTWNTTLNAQTSQYELFGSEMFSVGGEGSVRGFKKYSLSGRNGYSIQNNLIYDLTSNFKLTAFLDFGEILDSEATDSLLLGSGVKLGLDSKYFSSNLTYSKGLKVPKQFKKEDGMLYFNFSIKF